MPVSAQPLARWLVARPQNAVLGLAATLLLPFAQIISGAVMVLVALQHGIRIAILEGAAAALVLGAVSLLLTAPLAQLMINALLTWLPVLLLAALMRSARSLTLALQVAAIGALLVTAGFYLVLADPAAFWAEVLRRMSVVFAEIGMTGQAEVLATQTAVIAPQMTMLIVSTTWSVYVLVLTLGYALYRALAVAGPTFGRFCDLNFGRILALIMAVASISAVLADAEWLQNLAFVAFAVFWVQGLAIVHWLHAEGRVPLLVVIGTYVLIPVLNVLLVMALAVVGYTDAWFEFRNRAGRGT